MARSSDIQSTIAKLAALRLAPRSPEARAELAKALASKTNFLVERAAEFVREFKLADCAPGVIGAFQRCMAGDMADAGYGTRIALASALYQIDADAPEAYLAGIRAGQLRGARGGSDPAAPLRGICIMGLVRISHRDALREATDLLADPMPAARIGAARALAMAGRSEAALLLRLKLHLGDPDPEVTAECLTAIMQVDPRQSIDFVATFLQDPDAAIAESAALALGESRQREALAALQAHDRGTLDAESRRPLLLGIAITRLPEATEYLVAQLPSVDTKTAGHVLDALHIYRRDDAIRRAVHEIIERRNDPALRRRFEQSFQ